MAETILVLNAGSSSVKFQLFSVAAGDQLRRKVKGQIEGVGSRPRLAATVGGDSFEQILAPSEVTTVERGFDAVISFLNMQLGGRLPTAIGHRVVHGGPKFRESVLVSDAILEELEKQAPLAPLHQHNNLAPIRAVRRRHPAIPQVASFDTAFHRSHSEVADRYAIPESLYAEGIRRYGFHGLSYEYVSRRLHEIAPETAKGRVVIAHLGSGASMCAVLAGVSVESTMGFTALDGLPMGTRPGQLDPGVVLYLMGERGMTATEIGQLLYNECGLKGLSGISNDVRDLLASTSRRAKLAIDYFVHRVALNAAMLAAAMGGLDALIFTGGIGENAHSIRQAVGERLRWLGLELAPEPNGTGEARISAANSRIACHVIPTDEELMIARHTLSVFRSADVSSPKERSA